MLTTVVFRITELSIKLSEYVCTLFSTFLATTILLGIYRNHSTANSQKIKHNNNNNDGLTAAGERFFFTRHDVIV